MKFVALSGRSAAFPSISYVQEQPLVFKYMETNSKVMVNVIVYANLHPNPL